MWTLAHLSQLWMSERLWQLAKDHMYKWLWQAGSVKAFQVSDIGSSRLTILLKLGLTSRMVMNSLPDIGSLPSHPRPNSMLFPVHGTYGRWGQGGGEFHLCHCCLQMYSRDYGTKIKLAKNAIILTFTIFKCHIKLFPFLQCVKHALER